MAPALMSDSTTRLLTVRRSTRRQRSSRLVNGPAASEVSERPSRAATIASIAPSPTFLMAARPKRMAEVPSASSSTVKSAAEACTSGGRTSIPRRRHSATTAATFSARSRKPLSTAVMNSTG